MCGINGVISKQQVQQLDVRICKMNTALKHRGPNADEYITRNSSIALGHRRLSILDLDPRSNQPMQLNGGNNIIVFNGEIFNYREIKSELTQYYKFQTESDTEVLLASIEFKGIEWALQQANGMFAFAVYNTKTNETILARDRFGIKPLFYAIINETLVFSSEIKAILSSGLVKARFNENAIDDYLANRYVREPFTFFQNIFHVKSSTYMYISNNMHITEKTYWTLPKLNFETNYNVENIRDNTEREIKEAFERWFVSDVRVGAYLSGGVDSSLTTAILSKYSKHKVDTYTIGFDDKACNEFEYAQQVADLYKTNHKTILCEESAYFDNWERLIYYKDAPLAVPNEIPLAQMSSELSTDITVVISGEGADELFGGYGRIFRSAFDYKNNNAQESFYNYFISKYDYISRDIRDKYLTTASPYRTFFDQAIIQDFSKHSNEENIFRFFHHYHIQGLLQRVDMTTMQTSVEARPPFLDHKLLEYVYTQVPYELKLHWNSPEDMEKAKNSSADSYSEKLDCPKYLLKKVSEKYLPKEIIYREKMGFPVPLTNWFTQLHTMANEILKDASWLNQAELDNLIEELKKNSRAGQLLWMFLNIQLFYNTYFKKEWTW